jgi:hypothetical protein
MNARSLSIAVLLVLLLHPLGVCELAAGPSTLVTVFNKNLGMIAEVRSLDLNRGVKEYGFPDVPAQIDPASVQLKSLTAPGSVRVLEQRFQFDLSGLDRFLSRYSGLSVLVTTREGEAFEGTLLDLQGGDVALRLKDGAIRVVKSGALGTFLLRKAPPDLVETPTLFWLLDSSKPGKHDLRVHYLTRGMQWNADYVAKVDRGDEKMELSGWASIENRSGASFRNARVQLVAGDVHQTAPPPRAMRMNMLAESDGMSKAAAGFQETPFSDYRFYMLQRAATLADQSVSRLPLFSPAQADVRKEYSFDGKRDGKQVHVNLVFENKKSEGLGIPLPAGKVRVYKTAPNGSLVFTGEDRIDHVPEGEEVELFIGSAFEIVGERSVLETRQVSKRSREETVQVTVRNQTGKSVEVTVIEHFRGNWSFVGKPPPIKKKEADKVEFQMKVPRKGEEKLQYKVLYSW